MLNRTWKNLTLLSCLSLLACGDASHESSPQAVEGPDAGTNGVHQVTVLPDGTFSSATLTIRDGDTVEWVLSNPTDSIIPTEGNGAWPAICDKQRPYDETDDNEFTGPMPDAPAGIFVLSPVRANSSYAIDYSGSCQQGDLVGSADTSVAVICAGAGVPYAVMDETWENPNISGVFIRALWNILNPAEGVFELDPLMAEIDKAVANGKLYTLGIKAGSGGTPAWIFDDPDINELKLHDVGSDDTSCPKKDASYANPTRDRYWQLYEAMLTAVVDRIKQRSDRFRALAYFKPGGVNRNTHENKLPRRCLEGCCNERKLAEDGYTPAGLLTFYENQLAFLAEQLPGKALAYALIQNGFPIISNTGAYRNEMGVLSDVDAVLPGAFSQTQSILDHGQALHGDRFVVQHLGLQPKPESVGLPDCPNDGIHPVPLLPLHGAGSYYGPGSKCPNKWVLREGAQGQTTGFQTARSSKNVGPFHDSSLQNLWDNSDAATLEIYEDTLWRLENNNLGVLDSSQDSTGRTMGQWRDVLETRRPRAQLHRHVFSYVAGGDNHHKYVHGSKCAGNSGAMGTVVVLP